MDSIEKQMEHFKDKFFKQTIEPIPERADPIKYFDDVFKEEWGPLSEADIKEKVYNDTMSSYDWFMLARYKKLSESFLVEFEDKIDKSRVFKNPETIKELSLDYIFANAAYVKDDRVFEDLLSEEDYHMLKYICEINRGCNQHDKTEQ